MKKHYLILTIIGVILLIIQIIEYQPISENKTVKLGFKKENINRVGKAQVNYSLTKLYSKSIPLFSPLEANQSALPTPNSELGQALSNQAQLLKFKQKNTNRNLYSDNQFVINNEKLSQSVQLLSGWNNNQAGKELGELFDTYLLKGRDKKGNVKFTGYFSPVINVNRSQSADYQYPIYKKPDNLEVIPTRSEILNGALKGQRLELAWAKSPKDIRNLQLQGSGFAKYPDGAIEYLAYGGNNARNRANSFKAEKVAMSANIPTDKLNVAPKKQDKRLGYTFFERSRKSKPTGAGSVELTPEISIAVDPRIIPLGACLLAEFPVIDAKGKLLHHEYKILLAQDTGGAIKGSGHIDFYTGVGTEAYNKARYLSHYGRVWIMMPKE